MTSEFKANSTPRKTPTKKKFSEIENINSKNKFSSPPKLKKTEDSPSKLINDLNLKSESDKTIPNSKVKSQKSLFLTKVSKAKKALQSFRPSTLYERDTEIEILVNFFTNNINNRSSSSMYISGPPGTGKTASVMYVLEKYKSKFKHEFKLIYLNCTSVNNSNDVYKSIGEHLNLKEAVKDVITIENYLTKSKNIFVIILDEIDQLATDNRKGSPNVLYKLFEMPLKTNVILVGIANALDLTDRVLPRLKNNKNLTPKLIHFTPYSREQILNILKSRLEEYEVADIFAPGALQILASKISAVSGDLRRSLDIARRAIELMEQKSLGNILQEKDLNLDNNNTNDDKNENENLKLENVTSKVELKHVLNVLNNVFSSNSNINETLANDFPIQQKIILAALCLVNKTKGNITIGNLYDTYKRICEKRNLPHVSQGECVNLVDLIATRGVLQVQNVNTKKKMCSDLRMSKISLLWDQSQLEQAIQDKTLLNNILNDKLYSK